MANKITIKPLPDDADFSQSHHFTASGLRNYWLSKKLVKEHNIDGDIAYSYPNLENINAAIGVDICSLQRNLGPRELRFLRIAINLSQRALGAKLGFNDDQMVNLAESLNNDRYAPLQSAPDTLIRGFYLGSLQKTAIDDYLKAASADLHLKLDAERNLTATDSYDLLVA